MTKSPVAPPRKPRAFVWIAVLAGVLGFVACDTVVRSRHVLHVSGSYGVAVDPPAPDPHSPTGYAHGVRSLVLPSRGMDGYHWIMQTQEMIARGDWRVRHVDYDGGPAGREVHWAAPFRLYLAALAWIDHTTSGQPWGIAVERAALLSGPILLLLALAILVPWLARRFSPVAAMLAAVGAVAAFPFYVDFVAGYADHHGLVNLCALACVLLLLDHHGDERRARWAVVGSGVAGGIGLWISAATQVPVLIGIGAGALVVCWCERRAAERSVWSVHPELFRRWGIAGAATSLLAYGAEYFPAHFALRLEVNHPLYALAWLGAGEALCRLARILRGSVGPQRRADLIAGLPAIAAILVLPAVILLSPQSFLVADSFLWRLHHDFIAEFETLTDFLRESGNDWQTTACWLPLLIIIPAGWLALRGPRSAETRAMLVLALAPAALEIALAWNQVRWWGLACALLVPVLAAMFWALETNKSDRRLLAIWAVGGGLLLAPGAVAATQHLRHGGEMLEDDIQALAERDLAQWLRQRAGDEPVVVAGSPTVTTALVFFGGLHGIGTLYWENAHGLRTAAELYAAPDDATAHAIVERNKITHIVIVTWDGFEGIYTRLIRGLPAEAPIPPDAFVSRLLRAAIPPVWLRTVPFKLPPHPALARAQIRVYEAGPWQTPAAAAAHAADFALEMADTATATKLLPALEKFPTDLRALTARVRILFQQNDAAGFGAVIDRLAEALPQTRELPLEDHVHVVTALAMASRFDVASIELRRALAKVAAGELRRLSPGTLVELLAQADASNTPWPDTALQQLAAQLVPPRLRLAAAPTAN